MKLRALLLLGLFMTILSVSIAISVQDAKANQGKIFHHHSLLPFHTFMHHQTNH